MAKEVGAGTTRGLWTKVLAILLATLLVSSLLLANAIRVRIPQTSEESNDALANNYLYTHTDYAHLPAAERLKRVLGQLSIQASQQSLESHYEKASVLIGQGRNEEALTHIDACLTLIDESGGAYEDLLMKQGCLRALLEDYEGAQVSFEKVLAVAPDNAQAWLLQTQLLIQAGDAGAAMEHLKRYLSLVQGDAEQLAVMAQLCFGAGAYLDTLTYGEQALALLEDDTAFGELYRCMGYAAMLGGDMEHADEYLSAAIERMRDNAETYYYRGVYRMARGDNQAALADFNAAITGGYETALVYYNRGVCYLVLEDMEALNRDMEKVVELNEDEELTQIALQILEELGKA